jgi:toxin-antitoxin system PIN domain toxin
MKIVDASVLLYAVNTSAEHHHPSRRWLDTALSGGDTVGLAWVPLLAFVRLTTKIGLFPSPLSTEDALGQVQEWCQAPGAAVIGPTPRHPELLSALVSQVGTGG